MAHDKEKDLFARGNLFQEPDSTLLLSGGMGRHWPDARGMYHNNEGAQARTFEVRVEPL